ncbi:MAG TPA: DUF2089 domain-containing protein [Anaerolineae bacterium]|nr:DUF2089 domain-containing protein [Anaerolineae bacterium]HNU05445.1 DUF2089 domain-containing protein [Anaerolineae bacterium]
MRKIIEQCPTCGQAGLVVSEVTCDACGTEVHSRYRPCPFCALNEDEQTFLLLFVRSRGNLKEVEKTLGVSYPTVRAKLDEIIERLASPAPAAAPPSAASRMAVLAQVQSGQLSAADALAWFQQGVS